MILEELRKLKTHPRSDELYALVRQRLPQVSLGTVYRNLDRLQREGTIAEIYCGDFVRYDGDVSRHDHFLCRGCHRVWDFDQEHGHPPAEVAVSDQGFRVEGHYTIFYGLCASCLGGANSAVDRERAFVVHSGPQRMPGAALPAQDHARDEAQEEDADP